MLSIFSPVLRRRNGGHKDLPRDQIRRDNIRRQDVSTRFLSLSLSLCFSSSALFLPHRSIRPTFGFPSDHPITYQTGTG